MNPKKFLIIGISGATCSGKSTLASEIHKNLKDSILMYQDKYFLPIDDPRHTRIPELNHINWEILTSLDMPKMYTDILKIIESLSKNNITEKPNKTVLILEGFLLFEYKPIADLCDLKYFLTLTKELCWERRKDRIYEPRDVPGYFEKVVWPEYLKNKCKIQKDQNLCSEITFIDGSKNREDIFNMVLVKIKKLLC